MYGHGDVVSESVVVKQVDDEKHDNVWNPAQEWYCPRLQAKSRWVRREMRRVRHEGREDELSEGNEQA